MPRIAMLTSVFIVAVMVLAACAPAPPVANPTPRPVNAATSVPSLEREANTNPVEQQPPLTLASGIIDLPAAAAFGRPGFHEPFAVVHRLSADLPPTGGRRLVIALWDEDRPQATCSSEHPLSGCATVDWSDSPSRPKVPPDGVFDNSLSVQMADGLHTFYLREKGVLADEPDAFDPG